MLAIREISPFFSRVSIIWWMDAAYIARMEHILDLYAEPADDKRPIVNFDEAMKQLVEHVNEAKAAKPGSLKKEDYEYQRAGIANIFMFFDRHRG